MNRLTRIAAAIVLTLALIAAATPVAHARPLGKTLPGSAIEGSWFGAALSWLSEMLGLPQTSGTSKEKASTDMGSTTTSSGGYTGSCIDPKGCVVVDRGNGNGGR